MATDILKIVFTLLVVVTFNVAFVVILVTYSGRVQVHGQVGRAHQHYYSNVNYLSNKPINIETIQIYHHLGDKKSCDTRDVFLVVLVTSSNANYPQRRSIRETWASDWEVEGKGIVTVFLVAGATNRELKESLEAESKTHRDLIIGDFTENYLNLTLKTLLGIRWVSENCRNVSYVLKTDDDVFVNYRALIRDLKKRPTENLALGQMLNNITVTRDHFVKWYTSENDYRNSTYPPYLVGTGYVLSRDLVEKIGKVATSLMYLNWEDVFVGICLQKLGVRLINDNRFDHFNRYNFYFEKDKCLLDYTFTSHNVNYQRQRELWKVILLRRRFPRRYPCEGVIIPQT